jgi:hypothetical protein
VVTADRRDLPQTALDRRQVGGNGELEPDDAAEQRGQRRAHAQHGGHGQDAQPRLQGRKSEVELQELEQRAQQPEDPEDFGRRGHREPPVRKEPQLQHRMRAAGLPGDEGAEDAGQAGSYYLPGAPAARRSFDDRP